jgi:hypothetical protein
VTGALDATQRGRLERLIGRARGVLEADLTDQAAGRFGIDVDGSIADENALRLDPAALATRRELVDVVAHVQSEGDTASAAVGRLLRETVFTHLNRLIAIRIAEALGLLPPALTAGRRSQGFRDLLELAPLLAGDETGGYWTYLQLCGDELAGDVPTLFDPRNPLLALTPSPGALNDLVELLADPEAAELWTAPDCLGWVYQFFNTAEERRAMREASAAPSDSRELAVRNQFFTPRYVVDFLVQNSLGRRLIDADPTSPLLDDLPLLIDPPTGPGDPVDLADVSVLDPACGSGHFLLAAYDVLERAWHHAGVADAEAAPSIVRALWGIEIDPRCTQVAAAALIFRARRAMPEGELPRPNIICARALPPTSTGLDQVLAVLPQQQRRLVERFTEALADAPVLGSLLKIEERLAAEVRAAAFGDAADPGSLADALPTETLEAHEHDLLISLQDLADATTASPAERLLVAEADDATRFVQALQRRYDAVLMNPPFGEPVPMTKPYLRSEYTGAPSSVFLESCFVLRGLTLVGQAGYVGAITSRAGLFLSTYERWRGAALLDGRLRALADLGYGVMEQAMVEAAAYTVGGPRTSGRAVFLRLLRDADRAAAVRNVAANARAGITDERLYHVDLSDLKSLPRKAMAYWLAPWVQHAFSSLPPIEGAGGEVRRGSWPGDDFRFLRLWWENPKAAGRSNSWVTYAKGGTYAPYYGEPHLVVDWDAERGTFRGFEGRKGRPTPIPENASYYFRPGLTWSRRTASSFAVRILPRGSVFADKGPGIFADTESRLFGILGWLNSRYARLFVEAQVAAGEEVQSGSASRSYEVGIVQRIPWPGSMLDEQTQRKLATTAARIAEAVRLRDRHDELTRSYVRPGAWPIRGTTIEEAVQASVLRAEDQELEILRLTLLIDGLLEEGLDLDEETRRYVEAQVGPHPASYRASAETDLTAHVGDLYPRPIDELVDTVVDRVGGRRYLSTMSHYASRRLELIAHAAQASVEAVAAERRRLGLLPPGALYDNTDQLVSYMLGTAFGRWDVRIGRDSPDDLTLPSLFDELRGFSPGMLVNPGGQPLAEALAEYPIELPPSGVLVDEPGHKWDVEARLLSASRVLFDDPERVVAELLQIVRRSTVREHLRRSFFIDHLSRYSKSRRKAPIYWPLYVPSQTWGVWVYAPTLSREALFAVAQIAANRLDRGEAEIARLGRERESGGAGRSAREVATALESEERLAEELRPFRHEAERIAGLGWEPDLDDGIILCAAPLAGLFLAWKDAATARQEIKEGKYPWASVSRWADQL